MKKTALVALSATFILTACAQQAFVLDNNTQDMHNGDLYFSEDVLASTKGATEVEHQHFFLHGIGQGQAINPVKVCGSISRVSKIEVKQSALQSLLSLITFGIYTPREASVYCR